MRSNDAKCHCSSSSSSLISRLLLNNSTVLLVDRSNISVTPINNGLLSSMIQPNGEMEFSQLVKAYNASMVLSGEIPEGKCTKISTSEAVLSSILRIL